MAELTARNYRCFGEQFPLRIPLDRGWVAFVGRNNSGKSSALRFIHEFQPMWELLVNRLQHSSESGGFGLRDTSDPSNAFAEGNDRPMEVTLEFDEPTTTTAPFWLKAISLVIERTGNLRLTYHSSSGAKANLAHRISVGNGTMALAPVHEPSGTRDDRRAFSFDHAVLLLQRLQDAQYVPVSRSIAQPGTGSSYGHQFGASFVHAWGNLKSGNKESSQRATVIQRFLEQFFGFERLEINATGSNELRLTFGADQSKSLLLSELGHGVEQLIFFLVTLHARKPSILLIDEPELGLHPALQTQLLDAAASLSGAQLMFATHSLGLARTRASHILVVSRAGESSRVDRFEKAMRENSFAEMLGELAFSSWRDFGAESVLLVEGVTDIQAICQLLRNLQKEQRIVVLPLGGNQMLDASRANLIGELTRFNVPVNVLIDSEKETESQALEERRQKFLTQCRTLGIAAHVLERRAIENYWTDAAVKRAFGATARCLAPFERLDPNSAGWTKNRNWEAAVATANSELDGTDLFEFLRQL